MWEYNGSVEEESAHSNLGEIVRLLRAGLGIQEGKILKAKAHQCHRTRSVTLNEWRMPLCGGGNQRDGEQSRSLNRLSPACGSPEFLF